MASELNSAQILQLLNSQLKLEHLMPSLLDIVLELSGAERGFLMLYDSEGKLVIRSARNSEKQDLGEETFQGSSSIITKVAAEKEALYIPSLPSTQDFGKTASVRAANLQSVICIPLFRPHQDSLLGILYIDSSSSMRGLLKQEHL